MTSDAIFQLPERTIISMSGPDTRALLQRVITADVEAFPVGSCRPGALLTPQGKILCDFMMFSREDGIDIDIHASAAEGLVKRLGLYKLKADVVITPLENRVSLWSQVSFSGSTPDPRLADGLFRAIGLVDNGHEVRSLDEIEIPAGIPAFGRDYGEAQVFPTDVNLDVHGGVGWKKGCFIGQEVVSRMKRRGTIRKRSLAAAFDGPAPQAGATLKADSATLGEITSASGRHAIALIRLDKLDAADAPVTAEELTAHIEVPEKLKPEPAAEKI